MTSTNTHRDTYERGLAKRRQVLGEQHVERALGQVTDFSKPLQDLLTEYCWGTVWCRDGLESKTRSLLNLAMLTALNRPHELALHVRGAIRNGASVAEIQEALLQTAIYAGIPAAVESFRVAEATLKELGIDV